MSIEGELARAGIITTDAVTVMTKPVQISEDVNLQGTVTIGDDTTIDGDLTVYGNIGGTLSGKYELSILLSDINPIATQVGFAVIPSGGDGYISLAYSVVEGAVGASGGTLELNTETGALADTIIIADAAAAGEVDTTGAILSTASNNSVAEGEAIWIDVPDGTTNAVSCFVVIEITRS